MKNILIIENGKAVNNMLRRLFTEDSFNILNTDSFSAEYISIYPDLIIADLTTVKNEKVELLIQLKSSPVLSFVPFIAITSGKNKRTKNIGQEFTYHLSKPIKPADLFHLVEIIIRNSDKISPW